MILAGAETKPIVRNCREIGNGRKTIGKYDFQRLSDDFPIATLETITDFPITAADRGTSIAKSLSHRQN